MKRYHQDKKIIARRAKWIDRLMKGMGNQPLGFARGRYRKRKPLDCGHTKCGICHCEKRFGHQPTSQERAAEMKMRED